LPKSALSCLAHVSVTELSQTDALRQLGLLSVFLTQSRGQTKMLTFSGKKDTYD